MSFPPKRSRVPGFAGGLLLVVLVALALWLDRRRAPVADPPPLERGEVASPSTDEVLAKAFRDHRSGFMVEGAGSIERFLPDDLEGARHQRFILGLDSRQTVLISHNIDLAPRLEDASTGDRILFRGQYEWNERGGVIHWTHHDPKGRRPGGWLRHRGRTFR